MCFSPVNVFCQFNSQARDPKKVEIRFCFTHAAGSKVLLWFQAIALSSSKRSPLMWECVYDGDPLVLCNPQGGDYTKQPPKRKKEKKKKKPRRGLRKLWKVIDLFPGL